MIPKTQTEQASRVGSREDSIWGQLQAHPPTSNPKPQARLPAVGIRILPGRVLLPRAGCWPRLVDIG